MWWRRRGGGLAVAVVVLAAGYQIWSLGGRPAATEGAATTVVEEAFAARRSGVWVEVAGAVSRRLADDREGARHQRFILTLGSGHTVLVAHNIDLAARVPLKIGTRVRVRGRYEHNERGGVVHWTHPDPKRKKPGGWIRVVPARPQLGRGVRD
jgi:hypothetical protein